MSVYLQILIKFDSGHNVTIFMTVCGFLNFLITEFYQDTDQNSKFGFFFKITNNYFDHILLKFNL